jgi:polysaccharide pyruvyl transferase CsaB
MAKCLVCGYYGQGNAGDEALLLSLLEMLPPHVTPIVLSGNPEETQQLYGVESCSRLSVLSVLTSLGKGDVFLWGGGSLMQDATSLRSPVYYAGLMAYAQQRGLTTIAWAQGIGPLHYPLTRWLAKQVLSRCEGISVRDRASAKLLTDWQIKCKLAPDPVWALSSQPVKILEKVPSPRIAVNLRSHRQLTPQRLENLTQALIQLQKATQGTILLVPLQKSKDGAMAHQLASRLPGGGQIIELKNPQQLKGLFSEVEMLIGMRLHSLIMAASQQCRCFALAYDPKVSNLRAELNLPGWELEEIPDEPEVINATWLETYHHGSSLSGHRLKLLEQEALIHQQLLEELII